MSFTDPHAPIPGLGDADRSPQGEHTYGQPSGYEHDLNPYETLIASHALNRQLMHAHDRLIGRLEAMETPAQRESIFLTPAVPLVESRERVEKACLSIGLYNPNPLVDVYLEGSGRSATPGGGALVAKANTFVVFPIGAAQIEVGADPVQLAATSIWVQLFRFFTVQAAFVGKAV